MAFNLLEGFSNPWAAGGDSAALNTSATNNKPGYEALQTNVFDNDKEVLGIEADKNEISKYVKNAKWVDGLDTRKSITFLQYKENDDNVIIKIDFTSYCLNKIVTIKILDSDKIFEDSIVSQTFLVEQLTTFSTINLNGKIFIKGGDGTLKLFIRVIINSKVLGDFCNDTNTLLKVPVLRYIPAIMKHNGWNIGYELQKKWFMSQANEDYSMKIDLADTVKFGYFLKYERFKVFVNTIINDKIWLTENAKKEIVKQINIWVVDGKIKLPTNIFEFVKFGTNSTKFVLDEKDGLIPEFDKYHIQHKIYDESILESPIDDMFCSLGSFQIKIIIFCKIHFDNTKYVISLEKVGLYIEDKFDFNGFQPLGFWSPFNSEAKKIPTGTSYYYISNGVYRDYRTLTKMGSDFHLFSDVHYISDNSSFLTDYTTDNVSGKKILKYG